MSTCGYEGLKGLRVPTAAVSMVMALALCVSGWIAPGHAESNADRETAKVRSAELSIDGERTRVEFVFSEFVRPDFFTLADDYRLVIDLPEVDWQVNGGAEIGGKGLVGRMRYARNRPGRSRIVLDLRGPAMILDKRTQAAGGAGEVKFTLDLGPTERETFLRTAGWPARHLLQAGFTGARAVSDATNVPAEAEVQPTAAVASSTKSIVVIDPGHGGKDPGAVGVRDIYEKDVALAAALALRDQLESTGRYIVHMTRDDDTFIKLRKRVDFARNKKAALFISMHADSNPSSRVRGTSVYTLAEKSSDRAAARHARRENAIDGLKQQVVTDDVLKILIELAQRDTMNKSVRFAQTLLPVLKQEDIGLLKRTHRFGPFLVLTAADVPSVLIEMGFMSNEDDVEQMLDPEWRKRLAKGIQHGVDSFFGYEEIASLEDKARAIR